MALRSGGSRYRAAISFYLGRRGRSDRGAGVRRGRTVADRARLVQAVHGRADRRSTGRIPSHRARGHRFHLSRANLVGRCFLVGLPVVSGILLTMAVDLVATPESWTGRGRTAWLLPIVLLALVPPAVLVLAPVALIVAVLLPLRRRLLRPLLGSRVGTLAVRAAFLLIPVLSFMALGQDLAELLTETFGARARRRWGACRRARICASRRGTPASRALVIEACRSEWGAIWREMPAAFAMRWTIR